MENVEKFPQNMLHVRGRNDIHYVPTDRIGNLLEATNYSLTQKEKLCRLNRPKWVT